MGFGNNANLFELSFALLAPHTSMPKWYALTKLARFRVEICVCWTLKKKKKKAKHILDIFILDQAIWPKDEKAQAFKADHLLSTPVYHLGTFLNFFKPQFPHLQSRGNNTTHIGGRLVKKLAPGKVLSVATLYNSALQIVMLGSPWYPWQFSGFYGSLRQRKNSGCLLE